MSKSTRRRSHDPLPETVPAGEFKTHCLRLMDEVAELHGEIVITKYGRPVAKLVPADDETPDSFGALKGTVQYRDDDLVSPDPEIWEEPGEPGPEA